MDGFRIVCVYSPNEDESFFFTDLHVSYHWLKRYLSHYDLGKVLLGDSFSTFYQESPSVCHADGWIDISHHNIYYPFLKGVETKVGYFVNDGFYAQRTFRHHVFSMPLSAVEIEELPRCERVAMEANPITSFKQVGRYTGATSSSPPSLETPSFSPPPNMDLALKYQQHNLKTCAFCCIASAMYEYAITVASRRTVYTMKSVAHGLFWLSRRVPPQSKYALGTITDFLRKHGAITVDLNTSTKNITDLPDLSSSGIHADEIFHLCHLKNRYGYNHHVVCVYQGHIFDSEHSHAIPYNIHNLCICGDNTPLSQHNIIARCISLHFVVLNKIGRQRKRHKQDLAQQRRSNKTSSL